MPVACVQFGSPVSTYLFRSRTHPDLHYQDLLRSIHGRLVGQALTRGLGDEGGQDSLTCTSTDGKREKRATQPSLRASWRMVPEHLNDRGSLKGGKGSRRGNSTGTRENVSSVLAIAILLEPG